jgi:biopolymer transport protein ExbD
MGQKQQKQRFLDVWIIESNTIYREVPFTVVTDWVQQSRLLADDMLRPSGTAEWFKVGSSPEFAPYLPRPEPFEADDQAEALAPVQLDFQLKQGHDEDDDVDMIPLIDVSLVLLIFFMLTAPGIASGLGIATPAAQMGGTTTPAPEDIQVGVRLEGDAPVYSFGEGMKEDTRDLRGLQQLRDGLTKLLTGTTGRVRKLTIHADRRVQFKAVRDIVDMLGQRPFRDKIEKVTYGVQDVVP